jgi:hypothetical protein
MNQANNIFSDIELEHTEMVRQLVKSPDILHAQSSAFVWSILHPIVGIAGEVPELLHANNKANLLEESGDILFYARDLRIKADLDEYQALDPKAPTEPMDLLAGRLLDLGKKIAMYGQAMDLIKRERMLEYLNGIHWHVLVGLNRESLSYRDALEHNINKLLKGPSARYAGGYSDEAAAHRADKIGTDEEDIPGNSLNTPLVSNEEMGNTQITRSDSDTFAEKEPISDAPLLAVDIFDRFGGNERAQVLFFGADQTDPAVHVGFSADMRRVEAVCTEDHLEDYSTWDRKRDRGDTPAFTPLTTTPRELSPGQLWVVRLNGNVPSRSIIRIDSEYGYQQFGTATICSFDSVQIWYFQIEP